MAWGGRVRARRQITPESRPHRRLVLVEAPNNFPMNTEEKALDVQSVEDAKAKVSDIQVVGNGDTFALLCKASSKSQGWMKSAKAMEVPGGCVVQVTTQQGGNVAEALAFVPGVKIAPDVNNGRKLVAA